MVWAVAVVAAIGLAVYLLWQTARRRTRRDFHDLINRAEALRLTRDTATPELAYAAKGFAAIALMKANEVDVDLHQAERTMAEKALQGGATMHQALSIRWGGVQAIHTDPELYSIAVAAAEEMGSTDKYQHGALAHLTMIADQFPQDFPDFVAHMQRS